MGSYDVFHADAIQLEMIKHISQMIWNYFQIVDTEYWPHKHNCLLDSISNW